MSVPQSKEETVLDGLIGTKNTNGQTVSLPYFKKNEELASPEKPITREMLEGKSDQPLFSYDAPEGVETEFSQPVMVTATYLTSPGFTLADNHSTDSLCDGLSYSPTIPTFGSILGRSSGSYIVCIRVRMGQASKILRTPVFLLAEDTISPGVSLPVPVASDISGIQLRDGAESLVNLTQGNLGFEPTSCQITPGENLAESTACQCQDFVCSVGLTNSVGFTGLTSFTFRLFNQDGAGSDPAKGSVLVSQSLPPDAMNLAASSSGPGSYQLTWESGGGSTSGFVVAWQQGAVAPSDCQSGTVISVAADATSYSFSGLQVSQPHSFRLCSTNANAVAEVSTGVTLAGQKSQTPGWYLTFDNMLGNFAKSSGLAQEGAKLLNGASPVAGISQNGVQFDGVDDLLQVADSDFINKIAIDGKRTITLNFRADNPGAASPQVIYEEGHDSDGLSIYLMSSGLHAGIWSAAAGFPNGFFISSQGILPQVWYKLSLTIDRNNNLLSLNLNGSVVASRNDVNFTLPSHPGDIGIGAASNGTRFHDQSTTPGEGNYFAGIIDELMIHDDGGCYDTDYDGMCASQDPCPTDHFNDHDGDGVCGHQGICNLSTYSLPSATDTGLLQFNDSSLSFTGTGTNFIKASPGSSVTLNYNWHYDNFTNYCPGCIIQSYIGLAGIGQDGICRSNTGLGYPGYGFPGFSGTPTFTNITVPYQPGIYYVSSAISLQFSCVVREVSRNPRNYIGVICVE